MKRIDLTAFLDATLNLHAFSSDNSNNGLQVEGRPDVFRAAFAVDACMATFECAAAMKADFLFVHHGMSWGGEPRRFIGLDGQRLEYLFRHGISLYAAHLPLDAHPLYGNNAGLAAMLHLEQRESAMDYHGTDIGFVGNLPLPCSDSELAARLEIALGSPVAFGGPDAPMTCRRIAVCSGGGGMDALLDTAKIGADTLLTGEYTHVMVHYARELGIRVLAPGHYATETVGPRAVLGLIRSQFDVDCAFIDMPTGR